MIQIYIYQEKRIITDIPLCGISPESCKFWWENPPESGKQYSIWQYDFENFFIIQKRRIEDKNIPVLKLQCISQRIIRHILIMWIDWIICPVILWPLYILQRIKSRQIVGYVHFSSK